MLPRATIAPRTMPWATVPPSVPIRTGLRPSTKCIRVLTLEEPPHVAVQCTARPGEVRPPMHGGRSPRMRCSLPCAQMPPTGRARDAVEAPAALCHTSARWAVSRVACVCAVAHVGTRTLETVRGQSLLAPQPFSGVGA
eukprot:1668512-Prymnesium_polylepis.3